MLQLTGIANWRGRRRKLVKQTFEVLSRRPCLSHLSPIRKGDQADIDMVIRQIWLLDQVAVCTEDSLGQKRLLRHFAVSHCPRNAGNHGFYLPSVSRPVGAPQVCGKRRNFRRKEKAGPNEITGRQYRTATTVAGLHTDGHDGSLNRASSLPSSHSTDRRAICGESSSFFSQSVRPIRTVSSGVFRRMQGWESQHQISTEEGYSSRFYPPASYHPSLQDTSTPTRP